MAFATEADVAARMLRALTDAERAAVEFLLPGAQGLVAEAAGKTDDWADALETVPAVLRIVTVEAVVRVLLNPEGLSSSSEQLGSHQYTKSYRNPNTSIGAGGSGVLALTEREERLVSRAVNGSSGSAVVRSMADELYDCEEGS